MPFWPRAVRQAWPAICVTKLSILLRTDSLTARLTACLKMILIFAHKRRARKFQLKRISAFCQNRDVGMEEAAVELETESAAGTASKAHAIAGVVYFLTDFPFICAN